MEVAYLYTKVRSEFGKQTNFSDQDTRILHTIPQTDEFEDDYIPRNPVCTTVDTCPTYSAHETNTDRLVTKASSIRHAEGGGPGACSLQKAPTWRGAGGGVGRVLCSAHDTLIIVHCDPCRLSSRCRGHPCHRTSTACNRNHRT